MGIKYGTDEWIKALCKECNRSQAYKEAAKNWEGIYTSSLSRGDR
ncbi:MAG: hypothetical protein DDT25_01171 [Chloroflexi bacterium]|nr:hypothetical protein [Chloroflexota bacterium]